MIRSELDPEIVIREFRERRAARDRRSARTSSEDALRESTIVGQMGIHPLITALESGAQYILAGRTCDIALFASDMIRRGIDPGLAYHVGHVLECGALACDPGSPSDCLVAEIYDDGIGDSSSRPIRRAAARPIRSPRIRSTRKAIRSCSSIRKAFWSWRRRSSSPGTAAPPASANSRFVHAGKPWPWSIKLEGSRRLGARKVSLIYIDPADLAKIPADVLVYGRNGVQAQPVDASQRELGIIVETTGQDRGSRGPAGQPADALPDSLRLSRPQGDGRQHRLSAVAQSRQLQARRRDIRRHRAERDARSRVLRELCEDQGGGASS